MPCSVFFLGRRTIYEHVSDEDQKYERDKADEPRNVPYCFRLQQAVASRYGEGEQPTQ